MIWICTRAFSERWNRIVASRRSEGDAKLRALDWNDLPLRAKNHDQLLRALLRFVLSGAMHTGFYGPLLESSRLDSEPSCVRWYYKRFARKGDHFSRQVHRDDLKTLESFFSNHHLPWWVQITAPEDVALFNNTAFQGTVPASILLDRLRNLCGDDRPAERTSDAIDDFVECMDAVPDRKGGTEGVAAYLSLLTHASDLYLERTYKMTELTSGGVDA